MKTDATKRKLLLFRRYFTLFFCTNFFHLSGHQHCSDSV